MWKHKIGKVFAILFIGLYFLSAGCGSASKSSDVIDYGFVAEEAGSVSNDFGFSNGQSAVADQQAASNRKLITMQDIDLEVNDFETFQSWLNGAVRGIGGYIEYSSTYLIDSTRMCGDWTVRVPSDSLESFALSVGMNGNVLGSSVQAKDVTLEYTDTESHKKALSVEQERLLALLEQAETLDEILAIEDRLTSIRYEFEYYEGMLRTLDNQVDYSTLRVSAREVVVFTEPEPEGFFTKLAVGFKDSCRSTGEFLENLALFLLTNIPQIIVIAICWEILRRYFRYLEKNRKKRRENEGKKKGSACVPDKVQENGADVSEHDGNGSAEAENAGTSESKE